MKTLKDLLKQKAGHLLLPVGDGPLKGKKWIPACGIRFIRGDYETFKTEAFLSAVRPGDVVYDIGGHVGYYAVIASCLAGPTGRVFTFEPRPVNAAYIRTHIKANGIGNVELIQAAVSDKAGHARFETRTGTGTGHLAQEGNIEVETVTLDEFIDRNHCPAPNFIKIDVEGGEMEALKGMAGTILKSRPRMLIATHGKDRHSDVLAFLERNGYETKILNPCAIKGDTEVLAWPRSDGPATGANGSGDLRILHSISS